MILYVNGDSHCTGEGIPVESISKYNNLLGPNPDQLKHTFGAILAEKFNFNFVCHAKSGSSVDYTIRTSKEFLEKNPNSIFILGVPSIEREEWQCNNQWFQINSSGHENYPIEMQDQYRNWVIDLSNTDWVNQSVKVYNKILNFKLWLDLQKIKYFFFNTAQQFYTPGINFNNNFLHPYDENFSFLSWCKNQGFKSVDVFGHYGIDAHRAWADLIEPYIRKLV